MVFVHSARKVPSRHLDIRHGRSTRPQGTAAQSATSSTPLRRGRPRPSRMQHPSPPLSAASAVTRHPVVAKSSVPNTSAAEVFSSQWRRASSKRRPVTTEPTAAVSQHTVPKSQAVDGGSSSKQPRLTDAEKVEKHRMIVRRSYYQKKVWSCFLCMDVWLVTNSCCVLLLLGA